MTDLEFLLHGDGVHAPEVTGVPQLRLFIVDKQVHRLVRDAAEQKPIPAAVLQDGAKVTAAVRVAPAAGLRCLAHRLEAIAE
jgi:hypothetical protein